MNAQGTAADAKATAPAALPAHKGKGMKAAGKAGLAEALLPRARKGAASFAGVISARIAAEKGAKAGEKNLSSLLAAAAGLKSGARPAQNPWETTGLKAQGQKTALLKLSSGLLKTADESEKATLGKEEKSDGRKKAARLLASHAGVTSENADSPRNAEGIAAAEKHGEAGAALNARGKALDIGAARPEQAARAVPLRVVDLRRRTADNSSDSGAQKITQTAPGGKEPGTIFIPQQAALKDVEVTRKTGPAPAAAPQSGLERLREMAGSELIRASNLILRDGGGEIRLVLKPESLGSVRIRMNLVDNKIEGRIIVDTSAVKQVMDQNIEALGRALTAGGFQTASLEVSVGGQNADNGRQMQEPPEEVRRVAAQGFERNIPAEESLSMGDLLVNLFV